jgi:hypothetical protein
MPRQLWHKVDPLDLPHPICDPRAVLLTSQARDELPEGAEYCGKCKYKADRIAAVKRL